MAFNPDTEDYVAQNLAYNEVSMGSDGQVLTDEKKKKTRERRGYCLECRGPPVLLFTIKKSRMNPLFTTKKPRTLDGLCADGICFLCHPNKDPNKNKNKNKYLRSSGQSPIPHGGRRSIPVITSQVLNAVQVRTQRPSPGTTPLSSPSGSRRISDPTGNSVGSPLATSRHSVPIPSMPRIDLASPRTDLASTVSDDTDDLLGNPTPSPTNEDLEVPARDTPPPPPVADTRARQYCSDSVLPDLSSMDEPSRRFGRSGEENPSRRASESSHQSESSSRSRQQLSESLRNDRMSGSSQPTTRASDSFNDSFTGGESQSFDARESPIMEEDVQVIISELDSLLSELMKVPGAEEIVAQSLVGFLREHDSKEAVLIYCLKTIWESCKDNDNMKREVMKLRVAEDIVKAMKKFSKSAALQEVGCGATWSLAIRAENRHHFIRQGSCAIIMAAIDRFKTHETVVSSAIGAARTLSPEDDAREPLRLAEGSKMVAKAMRAHPTASVIQRDGCAFLSNAAVDMKAQYVTVVSKAELETVVQAMHHHRQDPAVVAGACFALKNYTVDENNCRTLRKVENAMELIQHAAAFIASPECMEDAEDILESMQYAQSLDNSIEDEAYATFSSTVEQQMNLPGFVNRILEFVEENDWSARLTSLGLQTYGRLALSDSSEKERVYNKTNLSRIVQFAKNLKEEQSVYLEACNLFGILAGEESKRPLLISVGVTDILFHSLTYQRNESLIRSCLQALQLLASTNAGNCVALIRSRQNAIREALEANQTSDAIMMSAIAIFSLLE